ncbi:serine--tRNA ligase, partial [Candidatus Dojkabacteria bacterium]|nr:serine--tRNA ligase [Candidatus Dojkabacteria bacterium]
IPEDELDLGKIVTLYKEKQEALKRYETLRAEQNSYNEKMAKLDKGSQAFKDLVQNLKSVSADVKKLEDEVKAYEDKLTVLIEVLPNIPDVDVVAGGKENNEVIETFGEKPEKNFEVKDHVEIGEELGIFDFERAAKMGGAQMAMYRGDGALLEWALIQFFIKEHLKDGYEMILPPHLLTENSAYVAGQLPKFKEDVFWTTDGYCLLPTAETALANYYKDEIVDESELPKKLFAYTPCYRKEAGSYRANERGLMRMHQFNKVEMFQYTTDEASDLAFEELVGKAKDLVEKLGLHYNLVKLAAGDCSAGMARTYDVEVYLPGLDRYIEVSSCSNARDYQTRRGNMRFKPADGGKPRLMHSLNASGLATSRLMVAVVETYQNSDGSITVPDVLRDFVGKDKISKNS